MFEASPAWHDKAGGWSNARNSLCMAHEDEENAVLGRVCMINKRKILLNSAQSYGFFHTASYYIEIFFFFFRKTNKNVYI
jgi:hypothetical protein